jgi:vacuolar-type H+-ATPase subunit I/STV1
MDNDNLQNTLHGLMQSGSRSNPAYTILLHDYIKYHAVLVVEGGIFALLLTVLSVYFWRRFKSMRKAETRSWPFERKTYFCFGLLSTIVSLLMILIVTVNLGTVLNPQEGFAQVIQDLGTPQAGTQKAAHSQAVNIWVQSGSAPMPTVLQNEVRDRLSWQRPKAIVCSILFGVFAIFTACLWRQIINSRANESIWRLKGKALITLGVIAAPVTLLLMIMALANTQASFAPVTLTLLFS